MLPTRCPFPFQVPGPGHPPSYLCRRQMGARTTGWGVHAVTPVPAGLHAYRAQHGRTWPGWVWGGRLGLGWSEVLRGRREHAAGCEGGRRGTAELSPGCAARAARRGSRGRASAARARARGGSQAPPRPESGARGRLCARPSPRGSAPHTCGGRGGAWLTPPTGRGPEPGRNRAAGPERPAGGADNGSGAGGGGGGGGSPGAAGTGGRAMSLAAGRPPVRRADRGERPLRVPGPTPGPAMRCQG